MSNAWMTIGEVAAEAHVSVRYLYNLRHTGGGPRFSKLGDSRNSPIRCSRAEFDRWMRSRLETRTHERAS